MLVSYDRLSTIRIVSSKSAVAKAFICHVFMKHCSDTGCEFLDQATIGFQAYLHSLIHHEYTHAAQRLLDMVEISA